MSKALPAVSEARERRVVEVQGIVQGVGFRPFIYALAHRHKLGGWVRNDAAGVHIEVEGAPGALDSFLRGIQAEAPPLALVETVAWRTADGVRGEREFHIERSRDGATKQALVSPDAATCADCLAELLDPANRRYRYPFLNCTNCGPRFTITRAVPYDRAMTTMAGFPLCAACRREYDDPLDRRFHAQPNACPVCGPQARLLDRFGQSAFGDGADAVAQAARLLRAGAILAVKGLGGYHLACDPFREAAVRTLRERKARQDKPFALMARDPAQARTLCRINAEEEALLTSAGRPIVLLTRRGDAEDNIAEALAPRQKTLGVMLAYTPLHHLLLHDAGIPLVMTSGNRADEPIAYRDGDAFEQLGGIADYFLTHNRPIHMRCDDTVTRVTDGGGVSFLRRSRGYAPRPIGVAHKFGRHILACGGELKNTFCVAKESHAFLSHHVGDLDNYETLCSFREGIEHYCRLFDVQPELVAYDLHPEYLSTKYARELEDAGLAAVGIPHHHAHIASCLADNERPGGEQVIGAAMDGTGYGTDGTIWGGEFFTGSLQDGFVRRAHLECVPLPGGEAAVRQPWRMAIACLRSVYSEEEIVKLPIKAVQCAGERRVRLIAQMAAQRLNSPWTSSAGRLFDAVAALIGLPGTERVTYEGQAAIELELAASGPVTGGYPVCLRPDGVQFIVETRGIIAGVVSDLLAGRPAGEIAARFHRTMAEMTVRVCAHLREETGIQAVALSGGVFQNALLLTQAVEMLENDGFTVYRHRRVPANDGGLCLGQAVLAESELQRKG